MSGWSKKDEAEYKAQQRQLAPEEAPPHKKGKDSSLSKSSKKSNHKHDYQPCWAKEKIYPYSYVPKGHTRYIYSAVQYCSICGKVKWEQWGDNEWWKAQMEDPRDGNPVFELPFLDDYVDLKK